MTPGIKLINNSNYHMTTAGAEETVPLKGGRGYGSLGEGEGRDINNGGRVINVLTPGSTQSRKSSVSNHRRNPSEGASRSGSHVLLKTQTSMVADARTFAEGSIPHSLALGTVIGVVCGLAAYIYYSILFWVLKFVWDDIPKMFIVDKWPEWAYPFWIPIVGITMAVGVGVTVVFMGEPGDLPSTIKCVHEDAYVAMNHGE
jgi:hypothetical protein